MKFEYFVRTDAGYSEKFQRAGRHFLAQLLKAGVGNLSRRVL